MSDYLRVKEAQEAFVSVCSTLGAGAGRLVDGLLRLQHVRHEREKAAFGDAGNSVFWIPLTEDIDDDVSGTEGKNNKETAADKELVIVEEVMGGVQHIQFVLGKLRDAYLTLNRTTRRLISIWAERHKSDAQREGKGAPVADGTFHEYKRRALNIVQMARRTLAVQHHLLLDMCPALATMSFPSSLSSPSCVLPSTTLFTSSCALLKPALTPSSSSSSPASTTASSELVAALKRTQSRDAERLASFIAAYSVTAHQHEGVDASSYSDRCEIYLSVLQYLPCWDTHLVAVFQSLLATDAAVASR